MLILLTWKFTAGISWLCISHTGETVDMAVSTCAKDLQDASQSWPRCKMMGFFELLIFYTLLTVDDTELRPPANKLNKYLMTKL